MNMHTKLIVTALGICALPFAQASEFADYGRVIRVQPRVEQIRQPREECRTEYVQVPVQQQYQQQDRSAGGAIIGGIAGALLGNQVGGGSGRAVATAAGAIAGAVVGDRVDNNGRVMQNQQPQQVQEQAVRQCRMVDAYESRTTGYDVTYDYRGQTYTSLMDRDPGQRIRLRVSVEPERGQ
ncbi:glycine zipper 2TM domain-containing protein [Massilia pseudoviolaceinigra]|uniref:glycine zipper 2TM domain-containing protein n=1 Tax=Massilia pseudoviolaceinigra TaxID=3057165 RepID=UPI002796C2A7|nr:glycine zipper 2TM domain-containing protein [Massilia sp. CCM 9206]MDQ1922637.1 glycine zipper 2TM domain-containing protein [Massilia sp. CCM 9206]